MRWVEVQLEILLDIEVWIVFVDEETPGYWLVI